MQQIKWMRCLAIAALSAGLLGVLSLGIASTSFAHGDVSPQPVDIEGLKKLGDAWLEKNPYSGTADEKRAIEIGCDAYNQNCARCHGLGVVSGGIAPDLRYLEKDDEGDAWFISRIRKGYYQNGATKMPGFEGLMPQEAMWAIRAYINIRPEEDDDAGKPGTGGNCQKINWDLVLKKKAEVTPATPETTVTKLKDKAADVAATTKDKAVDLAKAAKDKTVAAAKVVKEKTAAATKVAKEKTAAAAKVVKEKAAAASEKAAEKGWWDTILGWFGWT